jgi:hypothetical protein
MLQIPMQYLIFGLFSIHLFICGYFFSHMEYLFAFFIQNGDFKPPDGLPPRLPSRLPPRSITTRFSSMSGDICAAAEASPLGVDL